MLQTLRLSCLPKYTIHCKVRERALVIYRQKVPTFSSFETQTSVPSQQALQPPSLAEQVLILERPHHQHLPAALPPGSLLLQSPAHQQ